MYIFSHTHIHIQKYPYFKYVTGANIPQCHEIDSIIYLILHEQQWLDFK